MGNSRIPLVLQLLHHLFKVGIRPSELLLENLSTLFLGRCEYRA